MINLVLFLLACWLVLAIVRALPAIAGVVLLLIPCAVVGWLFVHCFVH